MARDFTYISRFVQISRVSLMTKITRSAHIMHKPELMFELVNDFSSYPQFLPWCSDARIIEKSSKEIIGELSISIGGIRQAFTTRNICHRSDRIDLSLVSGPFSSLSGHWVFEPIGSDGCCVSLELEFEFSNRFIALAIGAGFSRIAGNLVDAFCTRADFLYGESVGR